MKQFVGLTTLLGFVLSGLSLPIRLHSSSVDEMYNLSEEYIPGKVEIEESRKVCVFPFRNKKTKQILDSKEDPSVDYLSRGIPAILVTEIRKIGSVYDQNVILNVVRHSMGVDKSNKNVKKKSKVRDLEGGGLSARNRRKLDYTKDEWDEILSGKIELKPVKDPRFIPLEIVYFREEKLTPDREEAFDLGIKRKCFYVVSGEYSKTGEDSLMSKYELTNLWDGSFSQGSHNSSFIRAFQEMDPLSEQIRRDLMGKEISSLNVDTGSRSGALVFLDGNYLGKTPLKNYPVTVGRHDLMITEKGYEEISQDIHIEKFQTKNIRVPLTPLPKGAFITVDSEPRGAEVFLGIERLGTTPLEKVKVPSGKNRLRLSKEGYIDYFTGTNLNENNNHKFNVTLNPGDSNAYYKNRDYVFLDYTYKDFSTYALWSSLLFYAGHIYFQLRANHLEDAIRPQIQIVNLSTFQALGSANPDQAIAVLAYEEFLIGQVKGDIKRYRRLAGDFGLQVDPQQRFRDGPMIYGMLFSLATSLTFLFLGLDRDTLDFGFQTRVPTGEIGIERGFFETKGHFQYNFRF